MPLSEVRTARDYNRGLIAPIRWLHVVGALLVHVPRAVWLWAMEERRRAWAPPAIAGLVGFGLVLPLDGAIAHIAKTVNARIWGDSARVLEWLGDYGQGVSIVLVALVIWQLDPGNRRRLLNWLAGVLVAAVSLTAMKMAVGRPRPRFDDPWVFLGPLGRYPLGPGRGVHHAWEFWVPRHWELWSMPSSHAAYAVVMTVFLSRLYARLRVLTVVLALVVCVCRVLHGAHYASDVVVGAALGAIAGRMAMGWRVKRSEGAPECA
jgi:membrane-associated phospholipid phosphatase